jgi:hypothetical protein
MFDFRRAVGLESRNVSVLSSSVVVCRVLAFKRSCEQKSMLECMPACVKMCLCAGVLAYSRSCFCVQALLRACVHPFRHACVRDCLRAGVLTCIRICVIVCRRP